MHFYQNYLKHSTSLLRLKCLIVLLFRVNESDLINKLIEKDENAFRILIDGHQKHVYKVCIGFLHDKEEAEDLTQEVFLEVFKSIPYFKQTSSLSTWLYRIAVNKSLNTLKKQKVRRLYLNLQQVIGIRNSTYSNSQEILEQKEQKSELIKALGNLPENQKIAFTLAKYDDLSYEEIATIMNISLSSVESLLFRAKGNLKKKLLKYYQENF